MTMRLRLMLSILVTGLAANPCWARTAHPQHGSHANAINNGVNGTHRTGANPAPPANIPIDAEAPVAPPVLPSHGITQQQIRPINLSGKTVGPANLPRDRTGAMPLTVPLARNAIGQAVAPAKNFGGTQPAVGPQKLGAGSPPILHGATTASPAASPGASPGAARVNFANAINRGGNGATVIRPVAGSSGIGGPARAAYGINGTTVRNRR